MFLLFAGAEYYPCGPDDFKSSFGTLEYANAFGVALLELSQYDWYAIFDGAEGKLIGTSGKWLGDSWKEDNEEQLRELLKEHREKHEK